MNHSTNSIDFLTGLIKNCEYYDLTEKKSLELINSKLSKPISRSTYYNYKKKLYEDEKFHSLKKSIYNSKLMKYFLLSLEEPDEQDGFYIHELIIEQYPSRYNIFNITKELEDKIYRIQNRIQSNFCILDDRNNITSNLTRVSQLPKDYTLRKEYVRCGKQKTDKCKSCPHGPYYYAYWREKLQGRDNSILRKKYLGTINPRL